MHRLRLFCTISIFLCALFSSRAQDWESLAVGYERIIFDGADVQATNEALLAKADCYMQLGRYSDASATLDRLRLFAFTPEELTDALYRKELMYYLGGEFAQAAALVPEVEPVSQDILMLHALVLACSGRYDESEVMAARCISWDGPSPYLDELLALYRQHPAERSGAVALAFSFFPPAGHFYNEAYGDGLLSLGLNAASIALTVASLVGGYWISGILGGAIALDYTFMGNIERNQRLVELHNNNAPILFGDRVRNFLARAIGGPRE